MELFGSKCKGDMVVFWLSMKVCLGLVVLLRST